MAEDDKASDQPIYPSSAGGKFYDGTIFRLFRGSRSGVIRSFSGREVPFVFQHVQMVGALHRFEDLREGMHVGFDVAWTSSGLRISIIRTAD